MRCHQELPPPNQLLSPRAAPATTQHPIYHRRRRRDRGNALADTWAVEVPLVCHLRSLNATRDLRLEKRKMGRVEGKTKRKDEVQKLRAQRTGETKGWAGSSSAPTTCRALSSKIQASDAVLAWKTPPLSSKSFGHELRKPQRTHRTPEMLLFLRS